MFNPKINQLILCMKVVASYSQIQRKHIKALFGQHVELPNVKPFGTYIQKTLGFKVLKIMYVQRTETNTRTCPVPYAFI